MMKADFSNNFKNMPEAYRNLVSRLRKEVCRVVPPNATVIVVSKGDDALLDLGGRQAWHFPQLEDGRYAGHYPASSSEAIAQLEELRARGGDFLVIPSTAYWWFDHYFGFKNHLESTYGMVASRPEDCLIFALRASKLKPGALSNNVTIDQALEQAAATASIPVEARRLESAGQVEEALRLLREALSRRPDSSTLVDEYARMAAAAGDFKGAQQVLLSALAFDSAPASTYAKLAETSLILGDLDRAQAAAQQAIKLDPDQLRAWKILGAVRGLRSNPAETHYLIELVKLERADGNDTLAERYLAGASLCAPDDYELNLELARLQLQRRQLSAAERRFRHLVYLRPSDSEALNELMELFCLRVEDHEIDLPGGPVDPALLNRFLAEIQVPGRYKLISAETHLRIAETLARVNQVETALASLTSALIRLDFSSEALRDFTARLLRPVVNSECLIPFHDNCALTGFLIQQGNGFVATHEAYKAQACYYLALAANRESWAARFNLAFLDTARGDVLGVLQHLRGETDIASDQAALVAWPAPAGRAWPQGSFEQSEAFERLKTPGKPWPKITVITPSFNQGRYIEETVLSVLNQAYPSLEYIVVDGASTDDTRQVLRRYKRRLTKLLIEPNEGQTDAINKGLQLATGDIILWLDSGDMLAPGSLFMVALSYLEEGSDIVAGFCLEHSDHRFQSIKRPVVTQATFNVECLGDLFDPWPKDREFYRQKVAFSRQILDKVGRQIDRRLSHAADYELWMRCAAAGGRLSVISWPVGLRRKQAPQNPTDLTEHILEQSRVRDRFVKPEPGLRRTLEIRQRLGRAFAQRVPEIAVVSTRAETIFSPDIARELKEIFAEEGLSVSFHNTLEAVSHGEADLIILLVHLYKEQEALRALRESGYQGPIVGWFWDNHHLIVGNYEEAKDLDVTITGHAFAADYLRSRRYLMGSPVPLCTTQWSGQEAAQFFKAYGLRPRSNELHGGFVKHATATKRNAFVQQMVSAGIEGVYLLEKDTLDRYFGMSLGERFKLWASHKTSICLPLDGDLSQRLFDALLSGQIPIVPTDIYDLDYVIPPKIQSRLPIVRMSEYSIEAVRAAQALAIKLFDRQGKAGILRRHRFALANHMFASRIATIISELRTTAGVLGERLASNRPVVDLPRLDALPDPLSVSLSAARYGAHEPSDKEDISADLSALLPGEETSNKGRELAEGLRSGRNVLFLRCEFGPCCAALDKTLEVLRSHYPSFSEYVVVVDKSLEHIKASSVTDSAGNLLLSSGEVLDKLSSRARGIELKGIGELVERLAAGAKESAYLSLSAGSLALEAIEKAKQFTGRLEGVFEQSSAPVAGSCLVTSLYDEQNLLRLIEYLACVVANLEVFERVVIVYESTNSLVSAVVQKVAEEQAIPPGRLLLLPYQKRPTFEELFAVRQMFSEGTVMAVANADIAFDASFAKIRQVDLSRNIVVLSRHDVSNDGSRAGLIRLENGVPNTFSADAWIFSTPFEEDFFLDYPIGSFHCDSFINYQISTSSRYGALNPCHDIKLFHLHDERFNSSAEKQTRDSKEIQRQYGSERERNGGNDPIRGVAWNTLATAAIVPGELQFQTWKYKGLIFDLTNSSGPTFGCFLIMHYVLSQVSTPLEDTVTVIKLRKTDLNGTLGMLLAQYQKHFSRGSFLLDADSSNLSLAAGPAENVATKTISFEALAAESGKGSSDSDWQQLLWPSESGKLLRSEVTGDLSAQTTADLVKNLRQQGSCLSELWDFFTSLPQDSAEKRLLAPFIVPQMENSVIVRRKSNNGSRARRNGVKGRPKVSLITSLFDGGEFLQGYLHNATLAAREAQGEVVIIDANLDKRDEHIVMDFLESHPDARNYIDYVHLKHDPGLYECWRIGIERARAELITNANVDDRRCPFHTARLLQLLHEHPEYAGACGSISSVTSDGTGDWFTLYDNQLWFFGEDIKEISFDDLYKVNERREVMSRNVMHCMPVWRKSLHERYGFFDEETYGTSADWAFWLKCAKAGERFIFDRSAFGRYFLNPQSHNRRNDPEGVKERRIIRDFIGVEQAKFAKQ